MSSEIGKLIISDDKIKAFEKDKIFLFSYKKLKKLLKAIAILTKDKNDESMVRDIRECSLNILSHSIYFFIRKNAIERSRAIEETLVMFSLLEMAVSLDFISENNASILSGEYLSVLNIMAQVNQGNLDNFSLNKDQFFDQYENDLEGKIRGSVSPSRLSFIKDSIKDSNLSYKNDLYNKKTILKSNVFNTSLSSKNFQEVKKGNFSERTNSILSIIKTNKSVTIKDISVVVKGVSEKTIQRELSSLVDSGVLKREGERRWSKYSLA